MAETTDREFRWSFDLIATIAVLGTGYFLSNFQRQMLAVLSDGLIADYALTAAQYSILGSAIFYPYAFLQIPAGYFGDRISPRRLLFFSSLVSALGAFVFASASGFSMLVAGRVLTSIGTSFVYIPALAVLRRTFGDKRFGTAAGLFVTIASAASMCSSAPLRFVSEYVSRSAIFWAVGSVSLILAFSALVFVKEDPSLGGSGRRLDLRAVINPGTTSIVLWFMVLNGTALAYSSVWGFRFLTEAVGTSSIDASLVLLANSTGSVFGSVILGRVADRVGPLKTLAFSATAAAGMWFALANCPQGSAWQLPAVMMLFAGLFNAGASTVGFAASKLFVGPENTGLVSGMNNTGIFIGSGVFTMSAVPVMSLASGGAPEQYRLLFSMFGALVLTMTAAVLIINRRHIGRR